MNISEALSKLDPAEDSAWTSDGMPKLEAVAELVGASVTRAQILSAAPLFSRKNPKLMVEEPKPAESPGHRRYLELSETLDKLLRERDRLNVEIDKVSAEQARYAQFAPTSQGYDARSDQEARMAYIQAQAQLRAERVARARAAAVAAGPGNALRTPLDAAMARKGQRGGERPKYPEPRKG